MRTRLYRGAGSLLRAAKRAQKGSKTGQCEKHGSQRLPSPKSAGRILTACSILSGLGPGAKVVSNEATRVGGGAVGRRVVGVALDGAFEGRAVALNVGLRVGSAVVGTYENGAVVGRAVEEKFGVIMLSNYGLAENTPSAAMPPATAASASSRL